jgi:hypothetical protein
VVILGKSKENSFGTIGDAVPASKLYARKKHKQGGYTMTTNFLINY